MSASPPNRTVLHVILKIQPTNGQYNEHCLPFLDGRIEDPRRLVVCSFLPPDLDVHPDLELFAGDGTFRGGMRALDQALRLEPDVVHVHAPQTGVLVIVAALRRRCGLANAVYTIQNSYQNYRLRNRLLMILVFAAYPRLVFCSEAARASMSKLLRRLARDKSTVIPNAVDVEGLEAVVDAVPARSADGFEVVSVGRLIDIKAPLDIVQAVADIAEPAVRLTFVGDGPLRPAIEAEAQRLGLADRVTVTGMVSRPDVYRHVAQADLFVSASHGEGLPVAVLESMLCGPPGVITRIPPHEELVDGLDDAVLVPVGDVPALAAAITEAVAVGPAERANRAAAGRAHVESRYGLGAMHQAYGPVYRAAAAEKGAGIGPSEVAS